ncbi:MAG: PD40 domain-containing protein [Sphingobacteriaceae bacterium]|nr:PD40 domain-containing protein [Sphingobacteriaceae bacterium]
MKFLIRINILLLLSSTVYSQAPLSKQINKQLKEAAFYFDGEDYLNGLKEYNKVLALDKKNETANLNALICKLKLGQSVDSVKANASIIQDSKLPEAMFYLGKVNHQLKNFDKAIEYFNKYNLVDPKKRTINEDETNRMIEVCNTAKKEIANPHCSIITNMGEEVNSPYPDYVPVITQDESVMYFTSRREGSSNNVKDAYGNYHEDVYISYNTYGKWSKPANIGKPINTETHDACVALSPDGQRMIVYRTAPDLITGDLYVTRSVDGFNGKMWGPLQKYGNEINSQFIETSACFSNDTSEIYFSSNRPGGYGGKDLYRIKKLPNGRWAMPFNLGKEVNTPYDDDDPYLHPDGITLFFSSRGHNTIGEYDVFKSVLDQETNKFSRAESLGYPINSVNNDRFFVLSGDGKHGYYSSVKDDSKGSSDIYMIDTRFGDNDIIVKSAYVYNDGVPGKAKVTLLDSETKQVTGIFSSNAKTGKFVLALNPLKYYKIIVEEDGFTTVAMDLDPVAFEKQETDLIIKMTKK